MKRNLEPIFERVRTRVPANDIATDELIEDYIMTISDRLCLRLGVEELPSVFESVAVDATVKMWQRRDYEGLSSENSASVTTSFVEDILNEYAVEIANYLAFHSDDIGGRTVRFL